MADDQRWEWRFHSHQHAATHVGRNTEQTYKRQTGCFDSSLPLKVLASAFRDPSSGLCFPCQNKKWNDPGGKSFPIDPIRT